MHTRHSQHPWLTAEFFENQRRFPPEKLLPYAGQHIAWSWDGSQILASDPDEMELRRKLIAAGHDPQRVAFAYVDDPSTSNLG
jgi:hypothetical protein